MVKKYLKSEDSFAAFLVKDAVFTKNDEYPILRPDMISAIIPANIMPFDKAICYRGNLDNTFICFYCPDKSFERVRREPQKYLNFFKRTAGIIGFDFSIHSDMPLVLQKSQIYDNLSLSYYYGMNGIPIIPNLRCGIDELLPEFLDAIPKDRIVAIGTHGFCKQKYEKCEWYCFIEKILDRLQPRCIVVYGSLNGTIFKDLLTKTKFVFFTPWINQRLKGVKFDGNQRSQ